MTLSLSSIRQTTLFNMRVVMNSTVWVLVFDGYLLISYNSWDRLNLLILPFLCLVKLTVNHLMCALDGARLNFDLVGSGKYFHLEELL